MVCKLLSAAPLYMFKSLPPLRGPLPVDRFTATKLPLPMNAGCVHGRHQPPRGHAEPLLLRQGKLAGCSAVAVHLCLAECVRRTVAIARKQLNQCNTLHAFASTAGQPGAALTMAITFPPLYTFLTSCLPFCLHCRTTRSCSSFSSRPRCAQAWVCCAANPVVGAALAPAAPCGLLCAASAPVQAGELLGSSHCQPADQCSSLFPTPPRPICSYPTGHFRGGGRSPGLPGSGAGHPRRLCAGGADAPRPRQRRPRMRRPQRRAGGSGTFAVAVAGLSAAARRAGCSRRRSLPR